MRSLLLSCAVGLAAAVSAFADEADSRILLVSPIHLGEQVWRDEFDPEFSPESVEVSRKLTDVYRRIADEYNVEFLAAPWPTAQRTRTPKYIKAKIMYRAELAMKFMRVDYDIAEWITRQGINSEYSLPGYVEALCGGYQAANDCLKDIEEA